MKLSALRTLYEVFDQDRDKVIMAMASLDNDTVTLSEIEDGNYFEHSEQMYSDENYVITYNGDLLDRDDAFYCDGLNEWFCNDDMVRVYEGRDENWYSERYASANGDFYEFRGEYYDESAMERNDIVYVEDTHEYDYIDNVWYHEDSGYFSYEEEGYTRGYHNGSYKSVSFEGKSKYRIGYEIEKEDHDVLGSITISDFEDETDGVWRKEKDGSLCSESGFELISPTFEFNIDKIFEHIEGNEYLVNHINAQKSTSCGGHIHLSEQGLSGDELFDKIKGYTPLFYALYYGRVDQNYCKGKNNNDLKRDNEKYQAIKIHHDRVEFRIISAVPNVNTLKWRSKLLMMMLQNPTNDVIKAYYNVDTKFTKLLKQTYSDDRLSVVKDRFVNFTRQFEGLEINNK